MCGDVQVVKAPLSTRQTVSAGSLTVNVRVALVVVMVPRWVRT